MNPLDLALAALPIVAIIVMLALRTPTIPAALITIVGTLALSFRFPIDGDEASELAGSLGGTSIAVVLIMFGGIILSEFLTASGAQDRISNWLGHATRTPDRAILFIGVAVAPLVESIIGWGVGVIVAIPLLMRVGLDITRACTIALLGIILAPWGSLAPSLLLMADMSGYPMNEIGLWSALLNLPVLLIMGVAIAIVGLGRARTLRKLPELFTTVILMWVTLAAANAWVSPNLAGVLASLIGVASFLTFARAGGPLPAIDADTWRALSPYLLLIGSMLIVTAITSIIDTGAWETLIISPALWLMVAAAIAPLMLRMPARLVPRSIRAGTVVWLPVCAITILFIAFGALLSANGMSDTLAAGAAGLGNGFLLLMPIIGFLGGYVTASNTAVTAMLTTGVTEATTALGGNPLVALGTQNAAAGAAVMTSPSRVALAIGVGNGLRTTDAAPADPARIMFVVLSVNVLVALVLSPLTLVLAYADLPLP